MVFCQDMQSFKLICLPKVEWLDDKHVFFEEVKSMVILEAWSNWSTEMAKLGIRSSWAAPTADLCTS